MKNGPLISLEFVVCYYQDIRDIIKLRQDKQ